MVPHASGSDIVGRLGVATSVQVHKSFCDGIVIKWSWFESGNGSVIVARIITDGADNSVTVL